MLAAKDSSVPGFRFQSLDVRSVLLPYDGVLCGIALVLPGNPWRVSNGDIT